MRLFMSFLQKASLLDERIVLLTKVIDLQADVRFLDANDPLITRTVIISSYSTWQQRTLNSEKMTPAIRQGTIDDEDLSNEKDERELNSDTLRELKSKVIDLFERIILNEGHKLQFVKTRTAHSIALLKVDHFVYLSITLMLNRFSNLNNFLSLI